MESILENQVRLIKNIPLGFKRYMYYKINWSNRMIGLVGPRGVGKTTLALQYIKEHIDSKKFLYYSADSITHRVKTLVDLADTFYKNNGNFLILDEIHKYDHWSQELKEIYDTYPDLQVLFTGSSVLDIHSGLSDLSRRASMYEMQGLSFREYLSLNKISDPDVFSLEDIILHRESIPNIDHPLPLFKKYLLNGYYPYGNGPDFDNKLSQVIVQTMETDIPMYANLHTATGRKLKKLLEIIADSVPFKPSMQKLAELIGVSRNQIADYLLYMERAGMIAQLTSERRGIRSLGKVAKIYLDNTNLCYALSVQEPNIGNIRETFFLNQMRVNYDVRSSDLSDFCINDKTFELGGRHKGTKQISDIKNSYIVKDDIEFGFDNIIPLWAFGLTY